MLKPQKIIHLCIFPKIYNILSFYSKGNYSVGISVIEESSDGKIVKSFLPLIVNQKQNRNTPARKASVRQNGQGKIYQFMTEQFYVNYNEESVFLSSMAMFKIQIDDSTLTSKINNSKIQGSRDKKTKIYIDFKLYLNKTKTIRVSDEQNKQVARNDSSQANKNSITESMESKEFKDQKKQYNSISASVGTPIHSSFQINLKKMQAQKTKTIKKVVEMDHHRVYLNLNKITEIDTYKRILFSQCQFFSTLDLYIGSVYLGTKFRFQPYNLTDFSQMQEPIRINNHLKIIKLKQQIPDCKQEYGQLLKKSAGLHMTKIITSNAQALPILQLQQFRKKYSNLSQACLSFLKIRIKSLLRLLSNLKTTNTTPEYKLVKDCIDNDLILPTTTVKNIKQLKQYFETDLISELYYEIYKEICELDCYIREVWQAYCRLILHSDANIFQEQVDKGLTRDNLMKINHSTVHEVTIKDDLRANHHQIFLKRRKQVIDDMEIFEDDDIYHPFLMLEGYETKKSAVHLQPESHPTNITSLVVFVHGYQGSDYDLQKARNFMVLYSPTSYGLMIKSIQDQIDEDLEHLGQRVAEQIRNHIRLTINNYSKINFVGYSLGGVIIRESLKHLQQFEQKMNIFITFASPHLGVVKNDNPLVGTGIWYLINVSNVKNLKQLNCQELPKIKESEISENQQLRGSEAQNKKSADNKKKKDNQHEDNIEEDNQNCYLEKLSNSSCLSWFKKTVLVSSKEDNFVPYYSSRIDPDPSKYTSDQRILKMSQNIIKKSKKIERVEVWFDVEHDINTFDKILGRRAHIQFLENRVFLDLFFRMYSHEL